MACGDRRRRQQRRGVFNFLRRLSTDVFEEIFATPLGLDFAQIARLYGLVYSRCTSARLEPRSRRDRQSRADDGGRAFQADDSVSAIALLGAAAQVTD